MSRCPELHLYISKKETSNIRSKRRKRQSDLRGFFLITKNEENHFRYPKSLPNIKMDSMGGIRKKKAERPESFFIEKTGKTTPRVLQTSSQNYHGNLSFSEGKRIIRLATGMVWRIT